MGQCVTFKGVNKRLRAPPGRDDIQTIDAFGNGNCVVTAWQLTAEEVADINRTGKIFVSIMSGPTIHPTFVGSSRSVRDLVADYGGTFPHQPDEGEEN